MILCTLKCVKYISILYDSMEANSWYGFDKWMCFKCGRVFHLRKKVGYDRNTLMLLDSDCNHPVCSYCDSCWSIFNAVVGSTDFQQFNILRLDYQCMSLTQDLVNTFVGVSREMCNKCFLFNMLVCFIRAKVFRHILDVGGALMNLGIGTVCTLQGLFDNVGHWTRDDFLDLAELLDKANDASEAFRILHKVLVEF